MFGSIRLIILLLAGFTFTLQGCVAGVAAGATTTGVVAHDRRDTGSFLNDEIIEWKVLDAMRGDKELHEKSHINATSFNQIVLLTGEIPNETLRGRAGEIAKGIQEIRQVHNETTLAAPSSMMSRSGDTWITSKVKTALINENTDVATRTKVVTEQGIVFLMGIVTREESDVATGVARRVGGVQRVVKVFEYED